MMSLTHAVFAVTASSLTLGTASPWVLMVAAMGSQLPDCDTSTSYPGRVLRPISTRLEAKYPHRTITHSFLSTGILAVVSLPLGLFGLPWGGLVTGYFFGWFADVFTKSGVPAFWPNRARLVIPGNPRLRLSTGSPAEWVILALCLVLLIISINIHSQGGLLRTFNLWMGIPSGAVELVNQDQDRFLLVAEIDGINTLSQQRVEGTYQVVRALSSSDLLLEQEGKLYRAGGGIDAQIRLSRIFIRRGRQIRSEVEQVAFTEQLFTLPEDPGTPIQVTYTGILEIEDAFDLSITPSVEEFQPVTLQFLGDDTALLRFTSARREDLASFENSYGSGQMLVRRVYAN
ncbi:MAG: metal-dependent hydrolase [Synechococcaceae cyanobacterium SM2_3_2]|nr:metal-dependent hydrolase [Synechococcaceae cyanobacterium SM2_3_2]